MNPKAQAGLEYLMTYGWAIVLVATTIGVLVFITSSPLDSGAISISDPNSFLIKGSQVTGNRATMKLQNITGGQIEISSLSSEGYSNCTVNGQAAQGIKIGSGGEILVECTVLEGGSKKVSFEYTDTFGMSHTLEVTGTSQSTTAIPEPETICDDGIDNDGDGYTDCADTDCPTGTACGTGKICYGQACQTGRVLTACESLTQSGVYLLEENIVYDADSTPYSDCIQIVDNTTLDCQGNSITGTGSYPPGAVGARARQNITIRNCVLEAPGNVGLYAPGIINSTIENTTASNCRTGA